jgi:phosphoesterase RecJ-like protein
LSDPVNSAADLLERSQEIAIIAHERPDGDAVGSLLALHLALQATGKSVTPIMVSGVPGRFSFLPGADAVKKVPPESVELIVTVDCADDDRFGLPLDELPRSPDINIDHHPTNTAFARLNLVRPEAAATTEILYELLPQWGLDISQPVAVNLLTGLLTDTIGFRTSSTTAESLRVAAELIDLGAPMSELYDKAISQMSFKAANYWGFGLSRLEHNAGLVWTSLTIEDRQQVGYPGADDADLVNLLMTIEEARVVVLLVEQTKTRVKVSWRAVPGIDVAEVASAFGGGGHKPAAGAMIEGTLEQVQPQVLKATREVM